MGDDDELRLRAMAHCRDLLRLHGGAVPWDAIRAGFTFGGSKVFLGSTPRGIHKPVQLHRGVLSVRTTRPKAGRASRYDDEVRADGLFSYAFQGTDSHNHDNNALLESFEDQTPFIYFYAIAPGLYDILFPCFLANWDADSLRCTIAVGQAADLSRGSRRVAEPIERRYSTIEAKVRLHQAAFRELVLGAYDRRCAVSGLPIASLLDAAHIIADRDERGRPEVRNGICLTKLHHSAYDSNLIGIDPDGVIHVSPAVLATQDGPILEALKGLHRTAVRRPKRREDHPDRDLLAERFEGFLRAG